MMASAVRTVMDFARLEVWGVAEESTSWTVNENCPVADGVPEITPVELLSVSPPGKEPAVTDHVSGATPPVAATVAL